MAKHVIKQQDTTSTGILERLNRMAAVSGESFHAGSTMRLGAVNFFCDLLGVEGSDRDDVLKAVMSTPGWFLCGNNSACRQAAEKKGPSADIAKQYAGKV